jgi:serine/threonine-protein kinase RsbW
MTAAADNDRPARADIPAGMALTATASPDGVRAALGDIRTFLRALYLSEDACGTAEIVLAEALNNVAEHAYAAITGTGTMQINLALNHGALRVDIVDEGASLPGLRLPAGRAPDLGGPGSTLPEGGFGWFVIRSLTSTLNYQRLDGCNHLHMVLDLSEQDGAG